MRRQGFSVGEIASTLHISKGTASVWCRDIFLSASQREKLHANMVAGGHRGRLKGSRMQKEKREAKIKMYENVGVKILGKLSNRDLLLLGLGLHLGEGAKTENKVKFINSNPSVIKLFMLWMKNSFHIPLSQINCRVMINKIHEPREEVVRKKWAKILGIPLQQFKRTIFIKAKTRKVYENYESYLGTLVVSISKSSDLQYRILGLMKGLVYKVSK